jgi:hypothetical protein
MPINLHNPFKGRQHPGEVIVLCVRWYLQYPLSYEHCSPWSRCCYLLWFLVEGNTT